MSTITGSVLAGGMSLRMGFRKTSIVLPSGRTMLSTAANLLSVCLPGQVILSGADGLPDLRQFNGPMGGIESVLYAADSDAVLFVPCDMPFLTPALIGRMTAAYLRQPGRPAVVTSSHIEPLLAVVPVTWREKVTNAVNLSHLKVGRFWQDCGFTEVPSCDGVSLTDVDYPCDIPA